MCCIPMSPRRSCERPWISSGHLNGIWKERRQTLHKQIATVDIETRAGSWQRSQPGETSRPWLRRSRSAMTEEPRCRRTWRRSTAQQHSDADYDQLEKELQAHFEASWKTILNSQVGPTRQILRKLFNGDRLPFIPMTNEAGSQYEFKGTASIGRLLAGRAKALVSPTGFEPVLLP